MENLTRDNLTQDTMYSVFLSLDTQDNPKPERTYYTESIAAYHNSYIATTLVKGRYKYEDGKTLEEKSLYAINCTPKMINYLLTLAHKYNQESILLVNQLTRKAFLYNLAQGSTESIGTWTEVTESEALESHAFTKIADSYFIAK